MTMSGDQQSHVCTFCNRRTYACVSVPGGIACPTCKIRRREERCAAGLDQPLPNCECSRCRKSRVKPEVPATPKPVEPDPPPPRTHDCTCVRGMDGPDPSCPQHGDPMPDPGGLHTGGLVSRPLDFSQSRAGSIVQAESQHPYRSGCRCLQCARQCVDCVPAEPPPADGEMIEDPPPMEALLPIRRRCSCIRGEDGPDPSCPEHGEPSPLDPHHLAPPPEWDQPLPELEPDELEEADRRMFEHDCGASPEVAARFARIARQGRVRATVARRLYEERVGAGEAAGWPRPGPLTWPDTREIWADALRQIVRRNRIGRRGD